MKLSRFARLFSSDAGIIQLMDDLGGALAGGEDMLMLGGGNPGWIPQAQARFRQRMQDLLANRDEFERLIGAYDPPQGSPEFTAALAALLKRELGWDIGPRNIAVTNGSQAASFMLLNMFAGEIDGGEPRKILLPLTPEYIGYADQGLGEDFFAANRPTIEHIEQDIFKYRVDFDALRITGQIGAICVSRPTNPTGNVLTDEEARRLARLSRRHDIPLIIDNAYGVPFPNIIFTQAAPLWDERIVVCMSLSKLGLPGVRTGIVIAREDIIKALYGVNAILNLTTGGFGPALVLDMVKSGEITELSKRVIMPFYRRKAEQAIAWLRRDLRGYDFHIHKPEGAIFLWLWFRGLPISSRRLYQRLKRRGALVVSGHYFFPGLKEEWRHKHECIRVTYSQDAAVVQKGLKLIAEEVKKAYDQG